MFILLTILLVTATGAVLAAQVHKDGYGTRPAPRSHHDAFDPRSLTS